MRIFSVISLAVLGTAASLLIKRIRPELAMVIAAATGLILFSVCMGYLNDMVRSVQNFGTEYGLDTAYIGLALKIIGIAYVTQLGAAVCADAGESAIAGKVELCGRILILTSALPAALATLKAAVKLIAEAAV